MEFSGHGDPKIIEDGADLEQHNIERAANAAHGAEMQSYQLLVHESF